MLSAGIELSKSKQYGIASVIIAIIAGIIIGIAITMGSIEISAEFSGVFLGFLLAYTTTESLRRKNEEREIDHILDDVQLELEQLVEYLEEEEEQLPSFTSATGSWIKSHGLPYLIPREIRLKVLDAYTCFESYSDLQDEASQYSLRSDCDEHLLQELGNDCLEKKNELKKDAKDALDAIESR